MKNNNNQIIVAAVGFLVIVAVIIVGLNVNPAALQGSLVAAPKLDTTIVSAATIQSMQNDIAALKLQVSTNTTNLVQAQTVEIADQKMLYDGIMVLNNALNTVQRQLNIQLGVDSNYPTKK